MSAFFSRSALLTLSLLCAAGVQAAPERPVIPVWGDQEPPWSRPHDIEEFEGDCGGWTCAKQVVTPTLTLYLPQGRANGSAVLVLPGGGYTVEAVYHEGYQIAEALAARGSVAAVLKYRLPDPRTSTHPERVPKADLRRALKLLRSRQAELGFSADRFGVLGFSAGSHLAATASLNRSPDVAENPDFSILVYGVTRLTDENRQWLEETLYHRAMTAEEVAEQTLLERVDAGAPPAFLAHSLDDDVCHYSESTLYAERLTGLGIPVEVHLFAEGGHGWGPGRREDGTDQWLGLAADWLDRGAGAVSMDESRQQEQPGD